MPAPSGASATVDQTGELNRSTVVQSAGASVNHQQSGIYNEANTTQTATADGASATVIQVGRSVESGGPASAQGDNRSNITQSAACLGAGGARRSTTRLTASPRTTRASPRAARGAQRDHPADRRQQLAAVESVAAQSDAVPASTRPATTTSPTSTQSGTGQLIVASPDMPTAPSATVAADERTKIVPRSPACRGDRQRDAAAAATCSAASTAATTMSRTIDQSRLSAGSSSVVDQNGELELFGHQSRRGRTARPTSRSRASTIPPA